MSDLHDFVQRAQAAQAAVDDLLTREQQARERFPDDTYRVRCNVCGKSVSNPLPVAVIVRAWVMCPECVEAQHTATLLRFAETKEP